MQILSFKNYEKLSGYMADFIANAIKNKPNLVLCMASGSTPALTCDLLVQKLKMSKSIIQNSPFLDSMNGWDCRQPIQEAAIISFIKKYLNHFNCHHHNIFYLMR
jgi:hypothetical protein